MGKMIWFCFLHAIKMRSSPSTNRTNPLAWILGDPANWNGVDKKYFFTPTGDDFEWQYAASDHYA